MVREEMYGGAMGHKKRLQLDLLPAFHAPSIVATRVAIFGYVCGYCYVADIHNTHTWSLPAQPEGAVVGPSLARRELNKRSERKFLRKSVRVYVCDAPLQIKWVCVASSGKGKICCWQFFASDLRQMRFHSDDQENEERKKNKGFDH